MPTSDYMKLFEHVESDFEKEAKIPHIKTVLQIYKGKYRVSCGSNKLIATDTLMVHDL